MRILRLAAALCLALPTIGLAQRSAPGDSIPHAGEWAAEAILGPSIVGTSLIRFLSPRSALLLGGDVNISRQKSTSNTGFDPEPITRYTFDGRLGWRSYRSSSTDRVRPVVGFGARGNYGSLSNGPDFHEWGVGGYGELGVLYFVTSHLSAGATGEIAALYSKATSESGTSKSESSATSFGASLVRLLVSVYF